ncbi:hypothetical protein, partial [Streptomyces sp. MUM 2J]|uniref:hypothetical protein n=1 Tax=Streptomyces sp. MUM 2J TaxID=2791987 RepID=UPI001F04C667
GPLRRRIAHKPARVRQTGATPFRTEHLRYALRFDRLVTLLTNPAGLFTELFGWGRPTAAIGELSTALALVLSSLGRPALSGLLDAEAEAVVLGRPVPEAAADPLPSISVQLLSGLAGNPLDVSVVLAALRPTVPGAADGGVMLGAVVAGTSERSFQLSPKWRLEIRTPPGPSGVALLKRPGQTPTMLSGLSNAAPATGTADELELVLHFTRRGAQPIPLVGLPSGSGLRARELTVAFGARAGAGGTDLIVELATVGGQWLLDVGGAGGLIEAIIPKDLVRADLDVGVGWVGGRFYVLGSAGLRASFPVHLSAGPVELQTVNRPRIATDLGKRTPEPWANGPGASPCPSPQVSP